MPQLPQGFNARTTEPAAMGAPQLPVSPKEGWPVVITSSEMVATSGNANNGMLVLNLLIIEGEHKGEEGVYRLNLYHTNEKTVEIANRQLSAVCWVTGKPDAKVSEELHNIPFRAVVELQKDPEAAAKGYTQVKGVLDIQGNQPGKTGASVAAAPAPAAPPVPPAPAAPAWGGTAPAEPAASAAAPTWAAPAATAAPASPPWATK